MGQVIDVFRCAREVNELTTGCELSISCDLFLQKILDRFNIVICRCFDRFNALSIFKGELIDNAIKPRGCAFLKWWYFSNSGEVGKAL